MSIVNIVTPSFSNTALVPWSPELADAYKEFISRAAREQGLNSFDAHHIVVYVQNYPLAPAMFEGAIINAQIGGDALNPGAQANIGGGVPAPISLSGQGQDEAPHADPGSTAPTIDR